VVPQEIAPQHRIRDLEFLSRSASTLHQTAQATAVDLATAASHIAGGVRRGTDTVEHMVIAVGELPSLNTTKESLPPVRSVPSMTLSGSAMPKRASSVGGDVELTADSHDDTGILGVRQTDEKRHSLAAHHIPVFIRRVKPHEPREVFSLEKRLMLRALP
jgi:hypothetical protein